MLLRVLLPLELVEHAHHLVCNSAWLQVMTELQAVVSVTEVDTSRTFLCHSKGRWVRFEEEWFCYNWGLLQQDRAAQGEIYIGRLLTNYPDTKRRRVYIDNCGFISNQVMQYEPFKEMCSSEEYQAVPSLYEEKEEGQEGVWLPVVG